MKKEQIQAAIQTRAVKQAWAVKQTRAVEQTRAAIIKLVPVINSYTLFQEVRVVLLYLDYNMIKKTSFL